MRKRQKEAIFISFFKKYEQYEQLAKYIIHLIGDDPSAMIPYFRKRKPHV